MKYIITHQVESASGHQSWSVEAQSEQEAIDKHLDGESTYEPDLSEVLVEDLSGFQITDCEPDESD